MVIRSGANDVGCWRAEQDERRMDFPLIAPDRPGYPSIWTG
jgi:hypothetical protein